jgi:ArsR family transcriptional regulator
MNQPPSEIDRLEEVFKALADKSRLRILALLGRNEVCVCHIHDSLKLPQPAVSRHLAYLRRAAIVDVRRDGVWMHYRIARGLSPAVRQVIDAAVAALSQTPLTTQDRRHFDRAYGRLYVIPTPDGGCCCIPSAAARDD